MQNESETVKYPTGCHIRAFEDAIRTIKGIKAGLDSICPPDIIDWIESTVDLSADPGSVHNGLIKVSPWQVLPIRSQLEGGVEVTISAPEQSGKSMSWKLGAIYKMRFCGGSMLTIYEERDKAKDINRESFSPLLECVPEFKELAEHNKKFLVGNKYTFYGGSLEFLGGQTDLTSKPYKYLHLDEVDTWPLTAAKRRSQVANARKRWRTFKRQNLGSLTKCSSIKGSFTDSTMWHEFSQSNMGIYHLKCKGCKKLTINSTAHEFYRHTKHDRWTHRQQIGVLKYDVDEFDDVIESTCRLVCPDCGQEHKQSDIKAMCKGKDQYIYQQPRIKKHHGYLNGGLSCERALTLAQVCKAHNELENCTDYERRRTLYNSYFGIPIETGLRSSKMDEVLRTHCIDLDDYPAKFVRILIAADTQKSPFGWYYTIRGYDQNDNNYLIKADFVSVKKKNGVIDRQETRKAFEAVLDAKYSGQRIDYGLIDVGGGGEGSEMVKDICKKRYNMYMYKGTKVQELFKQNQKDRKRLDCSARLAADELLYLIYNQDDRQQNYWYIPLLRELNIEYIDHILNVSPDNDTGKDKKLIDPSARYDYFDCEKMLNILSKFKRARRTGLKIATMKIRR